MISKRGFLAALAGALWPWQARAGLTQEDVAPLLVALKSYIRANHRSVDPSSEIAGYYRVTDTWPKSGDEA